MDNLYRQFNNMSLRNENTSFSNRSDNLYSKPCIHSHNCTRPNCTFAHYLEQWKPFECAFRNCNKFNKTCPKSSSCNRFHKNMESIKSYAERLGVNIYSEEEIKELNRIEMEKRAEEAAKAAAAAAEVEEDEDEEDVRVILEPNASSKFSTYIPYFTRSMSWSDSLNIVGTESNKELIPAMVTSALTIGKTKITIEMK